MLFIIVKRRGYCFRTPDGFSFVIYMFLSFTGPWSVYSFPGRAYSKHICNINTSKPCRTTNTHALNNGRLDIIQFKRQQKSSSILLYIGISLSHLVSDAAT